MHVSPETNSSIVAGKPIIPWEAYKGSNQVRLQPQGFRTESTTIWSFRNRGDWASHTPQYRGNWSPYVVRNILELYSSPGDVVLDPMAGGGTTPVECLLTGRNSISYDINPASVNIVKDCLNIFDSVENCLSRTSHSVSVGDTRDLSMIENDSIDLIATHPPYANIIKYSDSIDGDLSRMEINDFFREFFKAVKEYHRILKRGKYCAVLVGDTHNRGHFVPIANRVMLQFMKVGFILKEDIIKVEWNCQSEGRRYAFGNNNFLLTAHEHLYVFRKTDIAERSKYANSSIEFFKGLDR